MLLFLNGRILPEEQATISVSDRSFLYGDGLFETIRVYGGRPFRWSQHLARLQGGATFLQIPLPFPPAQLQKSALQLISENRLPDSILRIHLSRGAGPRGYSIQNVTQPTLLMTLHPSPELKANQPPGWRLSASSFPIDEHNPLTRFKTANKLPQIMARTEAEHVGADEALMLNSKGEVAECSSSNIFWVKNRSVITPPISSGALPGITRALLIELCHKLGIPIAENSVVPSALKDAEGIFLTLSSHGLVEATALDNCPLPSSPLVAELHAAFHQLQLAESLNR